MHIPLNEIQVSKCGEQSVAYFIAKSNGNRETLDAGGDNRYSLAIASSAAFCLGASCASHTFHFRCLFERDPLSVTVISFRNGLLYSLESRLLFITLSLWEIGQNKILPDIKKNFCQLSRLSRTFSRLVENLLMLL